MWGDTRARVGGIDQPSPKGPSAHASWTNPDGALATAWEPQRKDAIAAPAVVIARDRGRMRVDFDFTRRAPPPRPRPRCRSRSTRRDEAGVPPRTYTFQLAQTRRGTLATDVPLDPAKHYDVYASTTSGDPPIPSESMLTELDPAGKVAKRARRRARRAGPGPLGGPHPRPAEALISAGACGAARRLLIPAGACGAAQRLLIPAGACSAAQRLLIPAGACGAARRLLIPAGACGAAQRFQHQRGEGARSGATPAGAPEAPAGVERRSYHA